MHPRTSSSTATARSGPAGRRPHRAHSPDSGEPVVVADTGGRPLGLASPATAGCWYATARAACWRLHRHRPDRDGGRRGRQPGAAILLEVTETGRHNLFHRVDQRIHLRELPRRHPGGPRPRQCSAAIPTAPCSPSSTGLYFANGVTPTADGSALVFAETQGAAVQILAHRPESRDGDAAGGQPARHARQPVHRRRRPNLVRDGDAGQPRGRGATRRVRRDPQAAVATARSASAESPTAGVGRRVRPGQRRGSRGPTHRAPSFSWSPAWLKPAAGCGWVASAPRRCVRRLAAIPRALSPALPVRVTFETPTTPVTACLRRNPAANRLIFAHHGELSNLVPARRGPGSSIVSVGFSRGGQRPTGRRAGYQRVPVQANRRRPAVDSSEVPKPGQAGTADPLAVPAKPIGGDALSSCGVVAAPTPQHCPTTCPPKHGWLRTWTPVRSSPPRTRTAGTARQASSRCCRDASLKELPIHKVVVGTVEDSAQEGTKVGVDEGGVYTSTNCCTAC